MSGVRAGHQNVCYKGNETVFCSAWKGFPDPPLTPGLAKDLFVGESFMNQSLIAFQFESFPIRSVVIKGAPQFSARDVALALGYENPSKAYQNHCKSLKKLSYSELLELNWANPNPQGEYVMPESDVILLQQAKNKGNKTPCSIQLYAVKFTNGVVKVGKGYDAGLRVRKHKRDAEHYGVGIARHHINKTPAISEKELISFCTQHGERYSGAEYFTSIDFDNLVTFMNKDVA